MAGRGASARPKWWQFPWHQIASFALGAFILLWQTTIEAVPSPVLVGAGVTLCGYAFAGVIQRAVRGGTNGR